MDHDNKVGGRNIWTEAAAKQLAAAVCERTRASWPSRGVARYVRPEEDENVGKLSSTEIVL